MVIHDCMSTSARQRARVCVCVRPCLYEHISLQVDPSCSKLRLLKIWVEVDPVGPVIVILCSVHHFVSLLALAQTTKMSLRGRHTNGTTMQHTANTPQHKWQDWACDEDTETADTWRDWARPCSESVVYTSTLYTRILSRPEWFTGITKNLNHSVCVFSQADE